MTNHLRVTVQYEYLEAQEDFVSRLRMGISRATIWIVEVTDLLAKPPDPPSRKPLDSARRGGHVGRTAQEAAWQSRVEGPLRFKQA